MKARGRILSRATHALLPGLLIIGMAACRQPQTIPAHTFILLQAPLQGDVGRPTKVADLSAVYRPLFQEIELTWTASIDPDTGGSNLAYRVYAYTTGPPDTYYRTQDLFGETPLTSFYLSSTPYTGTLYFVVTAFDGAAESEPSDTAELDLLPPLDDDEDDD